MSVAIAEVLEEWRRAERLLDELSVAGSDRERVQAQVDELRAIYHRLSDTTAPLTAAKIESSRRQLATIQARLAEITSKLEGKRG